MEIALQLYSVREEAEKDISSVLGQVKAMGYDGVEFAGLYEYKPSDIRDMLAEHGLKALSAHVPFLEMMDAPERVLNDYAKIGCRYVAIPYLTEEYRPGSDNFDDVIAGAKMLGEAAKELGMKLLYHNHDFELIKLGGKYALDVLYSSIPSDLLETEIDTCWVKVAGEDPAAYVRKYSGRAPIVHLKDFFMSEGDANGNMYELIGIGSGSAQNRRKGFEFRPLGGGMQDIPSILVASKDAGAEWVVVEQDFPSAGKTAMQCARESIDYLKSLGI